MRTQVKIFKKLHLALMLLLLSFGVKGQEINKDFQLRSSNTLIDNEVWLKDYIHIMVNDDTFRYRDAIRKAKKSSQQYEVSGTLISTKELLKIIKKGAHKSDNTEAFVLYLENRGLKFITTFDNQEKLKLYRVFRKYTFNGYLDRLDEAMGTI